MTDNKIIEDIERQIYILKSEIAMHLVKHAKFTELLGYYTSYNFKYVMHSARFREFSKYVN